MKDAVQNHSKTILDYIQDTSVRFPACAEELMEETSKLPEAMMATDPLQGQFLAFLIQAIGATRVIEVGTFTGVGTLWMAAAVGEDGQVLACDINDDYVSIGKPFWQKSGLADRIDLRLGPATETLQALIDNDEAGTFDFSYIDADKHAYPGYYELVLELLCPGGVLAFDNMLLGGRVAEDDQADEPVPTIRKLNRFLQSDDRVDVSFLPIGDGVYLARKR